MNDSESQTSVEVGPLLLVLVNVCLLKKLLNLGPGARMRLPAVHRYPFETVAVSIEKIVEIASAFGQFQQKMVSDFFKSAGQVDAAAHAAGQSCSIIPFQQQQQQLNLTSCIYFCHDSMRMRTAIMATQPASMHFCHSNLNCVSQACSCPPFHIWNQEWPQPSADSIKIVNQRVTTESSCIFNGNNRKFVPFS
jgi:hypothetical protein